MDTRTKFVFLMHPKEFKREKAGTGRLTHLCLTNSLLHMGQAFDDDETVQGLINDPCYYPVLLYPGAQARNLSNGDLTPSDLGGRQLLVFLLDATWSGARKMLKLSPTLQRLPRVMFTSATLSRYIIKQQPQAGCLSTLEATHELLLALERSGLDRYPDSTQLLALFDRMQRFQIGCAEDPKLAGYRRKPYGLPDERPPTKGKSGERRRKYLRSPAVPAPGGPS